MKKYILLVCLSSALMFTSIANAHILSGTITATLKIESNSGKCGIEPANKDLLLDSDLCKITKSIKDNTVLVEF